MYGELSSLDHKFLSSDRVRAKCWLALLASGADGWAENFSLSQWRHWHWQHCCEHLSQTATELRQASSKGMTLPPNPRPKKE